jgi:tRNA-binding protein
VSGAPGDVEEAPVAPVLAEVDPEQFFAVYIRVGRVLRCEEFPQARTPAYRLVVDFGTLGTRRTAARLVDHYRPDDLVGTQVVAVVNFPPRQIGPVRSEVLILGAYQRGTGRVVMLRPDRECRLGDRIG